MSTLKIKAPKAPLKGKGNKREPFNFRANYHADALRVAFWDALPPEHKTVACVGVRAKGYHSFGKFISPEALAVFRKAVLSEAEDDVFATLFNYPMSQSIQISKSIQSKPARDPLPMPNFATMEGAEEKARAWAGLPEEQKHPAPAEIMELKAASGLGWAGFEKWARGLNKARCAGRKRKMKTKRETNAELRARIMDDDDNIIRVKITRSGETHALTEEPRGDGGRVPWWKLVGYTEDIRQ